MHQAAGQRKVQHGQRRFDLGTALEQEFPLAFAQLLGVGHPGPDRGER